MRAVTICKESNYGGLPVHPIQGLTELVRHSLDTADGEYGVVAGGLLTLVDNDCPCRDLIGQAVDRYGADPERRSVLLTAAIRACGSAGETTVLQLERVRGFETAAESSRGMVRMIHLDKARTIASEAGLVEDERRLAMMIEHTDLSDEWQTIESTVEIDTAELRSEAERLVGDDGLLMALARFGQVEPIGDPDETRQRMAEMAQQFPLQWLMTRVVMGWENTHSVVPSGQKRPGRADRPDTNEVPQSVASRRRIVEPPKQPRTRTNNKIRRIPIRHTVPPSVHARTHIRDKPTKEQR